MTTTHLSQIPRSHLQPRMATGTITMAPKGTPVPGVLVSDGHFFARTDSKGCYSLPLAEQARWVQVINPAGSLPDALLYSLIPASADAFQANFTLKPIPHPADRPFTFVHLSDSHVASDYRGQRLRMEFVDAINRIPQPPAFVMDGGDVCINSPQQMEIATAINQGYRMPYLATMGNHDRPRRDTFEAHARPSYHAYTYHNYLILSLPWREELEETYRWMKHVLDDMGRQSHVLVSLHHLEGLGDLCDRFMELFREYDVLAMFAGHYHVNHTRKHAGIPLYIVRGAVARNSDMGRSAFNLIHATPEGKLRIQQRDTDHHKELRLVAPGRDASLFMGQAQQLWVSAYDTSFTVRSIHAVFHEAGPEGQLLAEIELKQANQHLWTASFTPDRAWLGQVYLTIEAVDDAGETWKPIHVMRSVHEPSFVSQAPARLKWVQAIAGSFNAASLRLHEGTLYAGVEHMTEIDRANPIVVAIDAGTGRIKWSHSETACSVRSTPLVHQGRVIAQLDDGQVICLDAHTGKRHWTHAGLRSDSSLTQIFARSSPIAASEGEVIIGGNHAYQRLALKDGKPVWTLPYTACERGTLPPSPVLAGDHLVTVQKNIVRVLDAANASLRWEKTFASTHVTPTTHGRTLYTIVREHGELSSPWSSERWRNRLVALDIVTGQRLWETDMTHLGEIYASPIVHNDLLYVIDYDALLEVDASTGGIRRRIDFCEAISEEDYLASHELCSAARYPGATNALVVGSPCMHGDCLYLTSKSGTVISIHLNQGKVNGFHALHVLSNAGAVTDGHHLFLAGGDGGVYALIHQDR